MLHKLTVVALLLAVICQAAVVKPPVKKTSPKTTPTTTTAKKAVGAKPVGVHHHLIHHPLVHAIHNHLQRLGVAQHKVGAPAAVNHGVKSPAHPPVHAVGKPLVHNKPPNNVKKPVHAVGKPMSIPKPPGVPSKQPSLNSLLTMYIAKVDKLRSNLKAGGNDEGTKSYTMFEINQVRHCFNYVAENSKKFSVALKCPAACRAMKFC